MQTHELQHALYLIADQMRGMASVGKYFAGNLYETERAHHIMALAAEIAALADDDLTPDEVRVTFEAEPWTHWSPVIGVDAAVFNPQGDILLIQRRDNAHWAMPGGLSEIGDTVAETAVKELWEEAGMRGRAVRLLGLFDARLWGSRFKGHLVNMVFEVLCDTLTPSPGVECLDAAFFAPDALPMPLHPGHDRRVPEVFTLRERDAYFDPADARGKSMPMFQRPDRFAAVAQAPERRNGVRPQHTSAELSPGLLHMLTRT
ncbi:MAG: NUDIX domain-containing protein [Anaerolineae bacterium]|nr:NUDIX domain-containing protein [Anaerolineae bacterium]